MTTVSSIAAVAAGWSHSIAVDATGVVSTWGTNASSQLGDGTATPRSTPAPISDSGYAWRVATPVFSVAAGTYNVDKTVVVTVDTADATIHYTQNGDEPTEADATVASGGSVIVTTSQTLKAKAWKSGMPAGDTTVATYTLKVATPTVSPTATTYTTPQNVTMSSTTPGSTLRYTVDGTDPTESSTAYAGAVNTAHTTTYRIIGFKAGWEPSAVRVSSYTMNFGTLAAPVIDQPDGTYTGSVTMTVSTTAPGVVHYTTALGTATPATPTATSPTDTPILFKQSTKVRARSFHPDYTASVGDVTRTYTVVTHTPTLSAASGSYAPGSVVTITAGEPSLDTLRMTIDGSDPASTSPMVPSGTSILLGDFTLKVTAFRASANDSAVANATYTLNGPLGPGAASAGGSHSMLVTPDGRVYAFGENGSGQLGIDSLLDRPTPTLLNTITGVTAISSGLAHTLARTWDGQVFAWGSNASGRIGDGNFSGTHKRPYHVGTLSNIVAVAAGDAHSLALTSDGRVFSWGENANGQLGLGLTTDTPLPTEIPSLTNIVAIAAGDAHSLALNASGQMFAWGSNGNSRLGDGTTTQRNSPVPMTLSDVVAIAAGATHSMAMTGAGAVFTWGLGTSGQLGHGATTSYATPHQISGMHANAIAAGDNHSAAIRGDGVLVAWGANASGQLGDTSTTQRNAAVVVSGPASVTTLTLGDLHSMAVTPSGELWTWGDFASGRLGDGSVVDRPTPASVMSGLANWAPAAPTLSVSSGSYASSQSVVITSSTPEVVIRYALTGANPTETDQEITSGIALEVAYSAFLRVRAFVDGRAVSTIARADYELQSGAPTIAPGTGTYTSAQTISMTAVGPPAAIRFTVDGSDPTSTSSLYVEPLTVSTSQIIKARAFPLNGWPASGVSSAALTFNYGQLLPPSSLPDGAAFATGQSVALSAVPGATIRFTTNGSDPTASSQIYSSAIAVSSGSVTIKARAYHPDWTTSDAMTESFTIDLQPPSVVGRRFPSAFNGWHLTPVTVTFACSDNVAVANCTPPASITVEGIDQTATGTAVDTAGHETTVVETFDLDLTPPVLTLTSPTDAFVTTSDNMTLTGSAADALSGLASVMCNGVATSVVDGQVSCTVAIRPGRNTVSLSALDVAGHSASVAVTVTRVGTEPSPLTMTPNERTMIGNEQGTLSLRDAFGSAITGALWSSTDASVVSLSTDDPPILTALTSGTVTITAEKDGLSVSSSIAVVESEVAAGELKWSMPSLSSPNLVEKAPIYSELVDPSESGIFTIATDTTTGAWSVWPVTLDTGEAEALVAAPGTPLLGDTFGGLVAGVELAATACSGLLHYTSPEQRCYKALVRFAGPAATASWRYESRGVLDRPAQGPDGTIYVTEHVHQTGNHDHRSIVILDGFTGAVRGRVPLANSITTITSELLTPTGGCPTTYMEGAPLTVGPIIGSDGAAYILASQVKDTRHYKCIETSIIDATYTTDIVFRLLRIATDGAVSETMLDDSHHPEYWLWTDPRQLLPDGAGGFLIIADHGIPGSHRERRLTRLDADGARTDVMLDSWTRIDLIGHGGTAFVHRMNGSSTPISLGRDAVDVRTWQTIFTLPSDWKWVTAALNGDGYAERSGEIVRFGPTGQRSAVRQLGLQSPFYGFGRLFGYTPAGRLMSYVANDVFNATIFDSSYGKTWVSSPEQLKGFGGAQRRLAPRKICAICQQNYQAPSGHGPASPSDPRRIITVAIDDSWFESQGVPDYRVLGALTFAVALWNSARDANWNPVENRFGNKTGVFFVIDQARQYGTPDVLIAKMQCSSFPQAFACIETPGHTHAVPSTIKLPAKNVDLASVRPEDLMGRLAHELGHKLGGHGAKHCEFEPSVMRGESGGGKRFINFVYAVDVELANQALMSPGSCTGISNPMDNEYEEPSDQMASRMYRDDFDQLLRKGFDVRSTSTQHAGFSGLELRNSGSSAGAIMLLALALFIASNCARPTQSGKDPATGAGHLSRVAAQAKSRGEKQTTLAELAGHDTSSTLDDVLSQASLVVVTPTKAIQSVTPDAIFTWQYFAVSDWLRHEINRTADDCSGPPPPVPTPDGQVVARLAKGRAAIEGVEITELSEANIEFGQKRYLLVVQECPGGYLLRPWGKDGVFEISANDELSLASFNSSSVQWQRELLDLGSLSALRKHPAVSR